MPFQHLIEGKGDDVAKDEPPVFNSPQKFAMNFIPEDDYAGGTPSDFGANQLAELGDFDMQYPHQENYDGEFSDVPPWDRDGKFPQAPSSMEDPSQQIAECEMEDPSQQVAECEIPEVPEEGPHQEVLEDPNPKVSSGEFPDVPLEDQNQEASDGESAEENKSTETEPFGDQIAEGAEVPVAQNSPTTGSMEDSENELPEVKEKRLKALRTAVV